MHRVSPALLAIAGFVALTAAPISRSSAQGTPPSTNATADGCSNPKTGVSFSAVTSSTCSATGTVTLPNDPNTPLPFSVNANATATPGTSLSTFGEFNGTAGSQQVVADGFATYYRYFTFGGPDAANVSQIIFTSAVNASTSVIPADPNSVPTNTATIHFGLLNPDNSFDTEFDFASWTGGTSMVGNVFNGGVNDELGGATSFWFQLVAESNVTAQFSDPQATASMMVFEPVVTFKDAAGNTLNDITVDYSPPGGVTGTPEPASLALLSTGLLGLGAFARRKRRLAKSA